MGKPRYSRISTSLQIPVRFDSNTTLSSRIIHEKLLLNLLEIAIASEKQEERFFELLEQTIYHF